MPDPITDSANKTDKYEKFIKCRDAGLSFEKCVNKCLREPVIQRTKILAKSVLKKILTYVSKKIIKK